jgi:hypothetical protein
VFVGEAVAVGDAETVDVDGIGVVVGIEDGGLRSNMLSIPFTLSSAGSLLCRHDVGPHNSPLGREGCTSTFGDGAATGAATKKAVPNVEISLFVITVISLFYFNSDQRLAGCQ